MNELAKLHLRQRDISAVYGSRETILAELKSLFGGAPLVYGNRKFLDSMPLASTDDDVLKVIGQPDTGETGGDYPSVIFAQAMEKLAGELNTRAVQMPFEWQTYYEDLKRNLLTIIDPIITTDIRRSRILPYAWLRSGWIVYESTENSLTINKMIGDYIGKIMELRKYFPRFRMTNIPEPVKELVIDLHNMCGPFVVRKRFLEEEVLQWVGADAVTSIV